MSTKLLLTTNCSPIYPIPDGKAVASMSLNSEKLQAYTRGNNHTDDNDLLSHIEVADLLGS